MNRSDIINMLIKHCDYKSYLEIGCRKNRNFKYINIKNKVGVDPRSGGTIRTTSDEFFKNNKEKFDIIFIDGLHHSDQVYRDIDNALKCMTDNGVIVVHDCNPLNYESQLTPYRKSQKHWNGDVWKAFLKFRHQRSDLEMFVIDVDEGCGIIKHGEQTLIDQYDVTYDVFEKNKVALLNLISEQEFHNWLERQ